MLGLSGGNGGGGASTAKRNTNGAASPTAIVVRKEVSSSDEVDQQSGFGDSTRSAGPSTVETLQSSDPEGKQDGNDYASVTNGSPDTTATPVVVMPTGRQRWVKGAPPSPSPERLRTGSSSDDDDHTACDDHRGDDHSSGSNDECQEHNENKVSHATNKDVTVPVAATQKSGMANLARAASQDESESHRNEDSSTAWIQQGGGGVVNSGVSGGAGSSGGKACSKKKKKSKSKGKNKAKKVCTGGGGGGGAVNKDAASTKATATRHTSTLNVTFGHIRMLEFTRDVGGCGVPAEGTWGLALGIPFRETMVDVDGYEASKAEVHASFTLWGFFAILMTDFLLVNLQPLQGWLSKYACSVSHCLANDGCERSACFD